MEILLALAAKLAERPDTSAMAMVAILLAVSNLKLILTVNKQRDKNLELTAENKRLQEQRIVDLQDGNKIIERNAGAINNLASLFQGWIAGGQIRGRR